jgi:phage gpG-like protein
MSFNEAKKIAQHLSKFTKEIGEMQTIMGVEATNHFKRSFRNQGFTDNTLEKWQSRKKRERGGVRAILTKTGRLKKSINFIRKGRYSVIVNTGGTPYARIHNEGGVINKKASEKTLNFTISRDGRSRFSKAKKANFQIDVNIKAHTIKMPKRQFIGDSNVLNKKIVNELNRKIRAIFAK